MTVSIILVDGYKFTDKDDKDDLDFTFMLVHDRGEWRGVGVRSGRHRGQTAEHAQEIERGSHRSIRKILHVVRITLSDVVVTTAACSCELEAKFFF